MLLFDNNDQRATNLGQGSIVKVAFLLALSIYKKIHTECLNKWTFVYIITAYSKHVFTLSNHMVSVLVAKNGVYEEHCIVFSCYQKAEKTAHFPKDWRLAFNWM